MINRIQRTLKTKKILSGLKNVLELDKGYNKVLMTKEAGNDGKLCKDGENIENKKIMEGLEGRLNIFTFNFFDEMNKLYKKLFI